MWGLRLYNISPKLEKRFNLENVGRIQYNFLFAELLVWYKLQGSYECWYPLCHLFLCTLLQLDENHSQY